VSAHFCWDDFWGEVGGRADDLYRAFVDRGGVKALHTLVAPVDPYNRSTLLAPIVTAAGVLGVVMLSGVALASAVIAASALLALYFLLSRVFGFEIAMDVEPVRDR
jgi:hypothetical protein